MKKLILLLAIVLVSCSEENTIETYVDRCEQINQKYSRLISQEAIKNGWNPQTYTFNTTTIGDGFLDPFFDPNIRIFVRAMNKYKYQWNLELEQQGNCTKDILYFF